MSATSAYLHHELFPLGADPTPYRKLTSDGVRVEKLGPREIVVVEREAIRRLSEEAMVRHQPPPPGVAAFAGSRHC
jgi:fumarate hydratase, class I